MVITKLLKEKNSIYTIILDNDKEYKVHEETVVKYRLVPNKEISLEELNDILKTNRSEEGYIKALIHIQKYPKSKTDMILYLKTKEYLEEEISYIIKKLEELNLINDEIYANNLRDYYLRKSYGINMIKHKMIEKHISKEFIDESIKNINYLDYYEYLKKLVIKSKNKYNKKQNAIQSLTKFLYSRGYLFEEINNVIEELGVVYEV